MSIRVLSFVVCAAIATSAAFAADTTPSHLLPNNDAGSGIRGQAPIGSNIITIDRVQLESAQAEEPAAKPPLNRAPSNMIDSVPGTSIRGQAPAGSNVIRVDRFPLEKQAQNAQSSSEPAPTVTDPPGGYLLFSPPASDEPASADSTSAAAPTPLPIEIVFHNMKSAECHPADVTGAALKKVQSSAACIELARETEQFKIAYKNDPRVLDALATRRVR